MFPKFELDQGPGGQTLNVLNRADIPFAKECCQSCAMRCSMDDLVNGGCTGVEDYGKALMNLTNRLPFNSPCQVSQIFSADERT